MGRKTQLTLIILGFLAAVSVLFFYAFGKESLLKSQACGTYSFINPLLSCDYKDTIDKKGYADFKAELSLFIEQKKREGKANLVAVWFRDLKFGPTFGINDRVDFIPASLLKLPLTMTFLELAEDNPDLLQQTIEYPGVNLTVPKQVFLPRDPLQKGRSYTIEELINHTIVYSDNVASQLLYDYLMAEYSTGNPLPKLYRDLGILEPGTNLDAVVVNTKGYGSIFRLLYNGSFLNKDSSEKILSLLAQSDFQEGLRRGVPENIVIAHKFGERFLSNGEKQLHDCGIVYYPGNPYQVCIMTKGSNFSDLKNIIQEISERVYREFNSRKL